MKLDRTTKIVVTIVVAIIIISTFSYLQINKLLGGGNAVKNPYPANLTLNISESGLPQDKNWSAVLFNPYPYSNSVLFNTTLSEEQVTIPNRNSSILIESVYGYYQNNSAYYVHRSLTGFDNLSVEFHKEYEVRFLESGLPNNTSWQTWVFWSFPGPHGKAFPYNRQALGSNGTTSDNMSILAPNGTFSYRMQFSANTPYYVEYPSLVSVDGSAKLVVNGMNESIVVVYTTRVLTLTVNVTGVPRLAKTLEFNISGTGYGINSPGYYSDIFKVFLPMGTFEYQASTYSGYEASNNFSNITISGPSQILNIKYQKIPFFTDFSMGLSRL